MPTPSLSLPAAEPAPLSPAASAVLHGIYVLSGFCALLNEVVWARLLRLVLGNTAYAAAVVVSTFMAGLALGAWWMGRRADALKRPLTAYAIIETLLAAATIVFPLLLVAADALHGWLFWLSGGQPAVLFASQLLVSALLLLPPTVLMGAGLPLLGAVVSPYAETCGRRVGRLYALNTLGAALGCYVTGFVLLRYSGVPGALATAAVGSLITAGAAWWLARRWGDVVSPFAPRKNANFREAKGDNTVALPQSVVLAICFLSGLTVLAYEIVWVRGLVLLLGGFTQVFAAVLGVYLVGHTLGAQLGGRLAASPRAGVVLAMVLVAIGLCGVAFVPVAAIWLSVAAPDGATTLFGAVHTKVLVASGHALVLCFAPALLSGMVLPLALQLGARLQWGTGRRTGTVYGANTIGAVSGGLLAGFVLLPRLGVEWSMVALGLPLCILGTTLALRRTTPASALSRWLGRCTVALALVAVVTAACTPAGLFAKTFVRSFGGKFREVREGVHAVVAVIDMPDGTRVMSIDNVPMVGDGPHRSAQETLGNLGPLLHPTAESVLTVGFGGGETAACLAAHPLRRIDCVEIAPEVVELALRDFKHINLGAATAQRVRLIAMDAKNYLRYSDARYDLIVNDSDVHSTQASAPLFTREHFQCARARLNPGGLFITKLHLQGDPIENLRCILRTFREVFPDTTVWFPVTRPFIFVYLVGGESPREYSPAAIDQRLATTAVRERSRYLRLRDAHDVLSCYLGAPDGVAIGDGPVNRDWYPVLEFNTDAPPATLGALLPELARLDRQTLYGRIDLAPPPRDGADAWIEQMRKCQAAVGHVALGHASTDAIERLMAAGAACRAAPGVPFAESFRAGVIADVRAAIADGRVNAHTLSTRAIDVRKKHPNFVEGWWAQGHVHALHGDLEGAVQCLKEALAKDPMFADAHLEIGMIYRAQGDAQRAGHHLRAAERLQSLWGLQTANL